MIWTVFATLACSVFYFGGVHYWAITLCHVLALAGLMTFLVAGIRREKLVLARSALYLPLAAGAIAALVYLYFSPAYFYARKEFLIFSCVALVFFVTFQWVNTVRRLRFVACMIGGVAALAACYGIYSHFASPETVLGVLKPAEYWGRASGTFMSPNHFGDLMAVAVPVLTALFMRALKGEGERSGRKGLLQLIGTGAALAVTLSALVLSFSRGSAAACIGGLCVLFLLSARRNDSRRVCWTCLLVIGLLTAGIFAANARPVRSAGKAAAGDVARVAVAKDSIRMIQDAPLAGHGAGMYRWVFPQYKSAGIRRVVDYAHNDYLHIAAETGVAGLAILLLALAMLYAAGVRAALSGGEGGIMTAGLVSGLTAGLFHASVDFNLHITANAVLLGVMAASIAAGYRVMRDGGRLITLPVKSDAAKAAAWIVAFAVFLWMAADARIIGAAYCYAQGERQTARLRWDDAVSAYRRAFRLDPKNPVIAGKIAELAYKKYIFARADRELLRDEALAWYTMAVSLNPFDGETRVRLADLYQHIGERDKAERELREALRLDPHNGFFYRALGNYFLKGREYEKAVPAFEETLRIYPKDDITQALLKRAKKQLSGAGHQSSEEKK